jgi:hypothetical protein
VLQLRFNPAGLKECPSAQLQTLGKLCEETSSATIHALGGTIAYTVKDKVAKSKAATNAYQMEVLTVAAELSGLAIPRDKLSKVGAHTGAAGHVLLTYNKAADASAAAAAAAGAPGGGRLLASCGHWIELSKLDVSEEALIRITVAELGEDEGLRLRTELEAQDSPYERAQFLQTSATSCVQRQSCTTYSPRRGNQSGGW